MDKSIGSNSEKLKQPKTPKSEIMLPLLLQQRVPGGAFMASPAENISDNLP